MEHMWVSKDKFQSVFSLSILWDQIRPSGLAPSAFTYFSDPSCWACFLGGRSCWDKVCLCIPHCPGAHWPWTHRGLTASAFQMLRWKACHHAPYCHYYFWVIVYNHWALLKWKCSFLIHPFGDFFFLLSASSVLFCGDFYSRYFIWISFLNCVLSPVIPLDICPAF